MYRSVKQSRGAHGHPSHPRWGIVTPDGTRIGTMHNMVYAALIVSLLNADAEKRGQNQDVEGAE